jgi:DNA-binding YbaB/EbfC family protein
MFDSANMGKILEEFQKVSNNNKEIASSQVFKASAGGGLVDISINGNNEIIELNIDDELLNDKDSLKVLLMSVINDVLKQADTNNQTMSMNMFNHITQTK